RPRHPHRIRGIRTRLARLQRRVHEITRVGDIGSEKLDAIAERIIRRQRRSRLSAEQTDSRQKQDINFVHGINLQPIFLTPLDSLRTIKSRCRNINGLAKLEWSKTKDGESAACLAKAGG